MTDAQRIPPGFSAGKAPGTVRVGRYQFALHALPEAGTFAAVVDDRRDWYPRPSNELVDAHDIELALRAGVRWVVIDMARLYVLHSETLSAFVRFRDVLRPRGGDLVLAAPNKSHGIVLEMLGLKDVFTTTRTLEDALRRAAT